ncbi:MFS transporter [Salmonella enterica subsp. enterica serovar Choleraesuis]|nr:MFS transporter [Salmonella enterica subsp. enterica serovar Choleraesuis]
MSSDIVSQSFFHPTDRHLTGVVFAVLTYWLFTQSVINVIPAISENVAMAPASLSFAISLSALFSGCFVVGCGGLADRAGHLLLARIGLVLSILASLALAMAWEPIMFFSARIIQGLSAACIMPATLALLKEWYQGAERQRAISFWVIGSWGGSGLCALTGGLITLMLGWRWIFIISSMVALLSLWLLRNARESEHPAVVRSTFDLAGLLLLPVVLVLLNLLIGKSSGWSLTTILIVVLGLMLCSIAFYLIERKRGNHALIDFSLFSIRAWNGALLSNLLLNSCIGSMLVTSLYLQHDRGFSAFQAGGVTLGYLVMVLVMIRVGERLLQRFGARLPMVAGALITAAGIAAISCTFIPGNGYIATVIVGYMLFGLGLGCYATPSTDTAVSHAPANKTGIASGIYKMGSSLGGAFGIAGSSALYNLWLPAGSAHAAQWVLWGNMGLCIVAAIISLMLLPSSRFAVSD